MFVTTHQPYFVDAFPLKRSGFKGRYGFAVIRRASDDAMVENMVKEGLTLGGLWYSDYLDAR